MLYNYTFYILVGFIFFSFLSETISCQWKDDGKYTY